MKEGNFKWSYYTQSLAGLGNKNPVSVKNHTDKKPNLKLCSNHRKYIPRPNRYYNSHAHGTAIADGSGWYVPLSQLKK